MAVYYSRSCPKEIRVFLEKVLCGMELAIRPFGSLSERLDNLGFGYGRLKVEKLINNNRTLGFSIEKKDYRVNDEIRPFRDFNYKTRHLTSRNYSLSLKKFIKKSGMLPLGNYVAVSLSMTLNFIDSTAGKKNNTTFAFIDVYPGFEVGKSLPLIGKHLIVNFSVGLYISGASCYYAVFGDTFLNPRTCSFFKNDELVAHLFGMNVVKANVCVSYAPF